MASGFLRGGGIRWIALEYEFAAQKMKEGQVATSFDLTGEGHGFIDARQRVLRAQRLRLEFRKQPFKEPSIVQHALFDAVRQGPTKLFRPGRRVMKTTACPSRAQFRSGAPERHPMLPTETLQGFCRLQRGGGLSAQDFKMDFPQ